jgi:hypothetical protein
MDFTVRGPDGDEDFTGAARYTFDEHGHLVVYTDDGQRRTYSASGWRHVDEASQSD